MVFRATLHLCIINFLITPKFDLSRSRTLRLRKWASMAITAFIVKATMISPKSMSIYWRVKMVKICFKILMVNKSTHLLTRWIIRNFNNVSTSSRARERTKTNNNKIEYLTKRNRQSLKMRDSIECKQIVAKHIINSENKLLTIWIKTCDLIHP